MPKQAHMADLQAKAAAQNLLLALDGKPASARFKVELICIVNSLSRGRPGLPRSQALRRFLPSMRLFHRAKRHFEGHYLKAFRE